MDIWLKLVFICPLLFLAGVIDGIAGGGGIIALPAYLLAGLPVQAAYGCNKLQSCIGTGASLFRYAKSGFWDLKTALIAAVPALAGSWISTKIILSLDDSAIKLIIIIAMVFILGLTLLTRRVHLGQVTKLTLSPKNLWICLGIGLVLGLYDGFFGPGGGTIAMMLFAVLLRYDMRVGNGNGKVIIVASNLMAVIHHLLAGNVLWRIALPATLANVLGSYLGASLSIKKGPGLVNRILLLVVVLLLVQAVIKLL